MERDLGATIYPLEIIRRGYGDAVTAQVEALWQLHDRYRRGAGLSATMGRETFFNDLVLDSLQLAFFISETDTSMLADLGSGAGFPGIPVAIIRPNVNVTLIEPAPKKAAYLRLVAAELSLGNVRVEQTPAEELPQGKYGRLCAKAFRRPEIVLRVAAKLVTEGGFVNIFVSETDEAIYQDYPYQLGLDPTRKHEYLLPGKERVRAIVEFRRRVSRETGNPPSSSDVSRETPRP